MNVQRFTQVSARRILQKPKSLASIRYPALATLTVCRSITQSRPAASQTIPPSQNVTTGDAYAILARQRLNRPVSPHLTIYQPQISWILSALNRVTGSILSGAFYIFGFTYLISPLLGWHIESSALAESFGELHGAVKGAVKFLIALPFTFHSWNGIRHLVWDSGRDFANKSVVRSGWAVVGLTVVSSVGLAFWGT